MLDLGLKDFPASEPIHIIALIGATFLRQRATQLKASSKCPRVEFSTGDASRPSTSSDPIAVDPSPSSSSNSSLRSMLDTVMIVQAVYGQILLDVLIEFQALQADLAGARGYNPPAPPFDDDS